MKRNIISAALLLSMIAMAHAREGGRLRQMLENRRAQDTLPAPTQMRVERDVPYGANSAQRMDVYAPLNAHDAPVIMMVHGGGWSRGDKTAAGVVDNKVARWILKGAVVVSVNYRLLPEAQVDTQAQDVADAARFLEQNASRWGGNGHKVILMGHSAGAHLVALVGANPQRFGVAPVLGMVSLDSGALNVPKIMSGHHFELHDAAFGTDPQYWIRVSPYHALEAEGPGLLLVCSQPRATSCDDAEDMAARARQLGRQATVLHENKSHGEINRDLGVGGEYTRQVELFLQRLDPVFR